MKKIKEKILCEGRWLIFCEDTYLNKDNQEVRWESIRRKKQGMSLVVVAKMIPSERYVLIKQFRQTIDGYILGLPAGISYSGPEHALVELEEETGYIGQIISKSPLLKSNVGVINNNSQIVSVHIDEKDPRNQNPVQNLEPSEDIQVFLLKMEEIKSFLIKEQEQGTCIGAGLWYLFGVDL